MFLIVDPQSIPMKHYFLQKINTPLADTLFRVGFLAAAAVFIGVLLWIAGKKGGKK